MSFRSNRLFMDLSTVRIKSLVIMIAVTFPLLLFIMTTLLLLITDFGAAILSAVFTGLLLKLFMNNLNLYVKAQRMQKYIRGLAGRERIEVKNLCRFVGKDVAFVRSDLADMINRGWFIQGHLVNRGKTLIVSDREYEAYKQPKDEEKPKTESKNTNKADQSKSTPKNEKKPGKYDHLPKEARETLLLGEDYLKQLSECNDAIPDIEMSIKISRIETIVDKIFERVATHPENVDDIKKLMKYYLPTTIKLLNTYIEYNNQPVKGENVEKSMKQIEDTLDTLNKAFEKLLDDLFEETTWDVASDISVLENLLKSDGLTDSDFE